MKILQEVRRAGLGVRRISYVSLVQADGQAAALFLLGGHGVDGVVVG